MLKKIVKKKIGAILLSGSYLFISLTLYRKQNYTLTNFAGSLKRCEMLLNLTSIN